MLFHAIASRRARNLALSFPYDPVPYGQSCKFAWKRIVPYPDAAIDRKASTRLRRSFPSSRTFTACPKRVSPGLVGQ